MWGGRVNPASKITRRPFTLTSSICDFANECPSVAETDAPLNDTLQRSLTSHRLSSSADDRYQRYSGVGCDDFLACGTVPAIRGVLKGRTTTLRQNLFRKSRRRQDLSPNRDETLPGGGINFTRHWHQATVKFSPFSIKNRK